jgi:hypothetical protein
LPLKISPPSYARISAMQSEKLTTEIVHHKGTEKTELLFGKANSFASAFPVAACLPLCGIGSSKKNSVPLW